MPSIKPDPNKGQNIAGLFNQGLKQTDFPESCPVEVESVETGTPFEGCCPKKPTFWTMEELETLCTLIEPLLRDKGLGEDGGQYEVVPNADCSITVTDQTSGESFTLPPVGLSNLTDNGDGTYTHTSCGQDQNIVTTTVVDNGDGTGTITDNQGNACTFHKGPHVSLESFTAVDNGDFTWDLTVTLTDGSTGTVTIDVNEVDMDIVNVTQVGSVLNFTAEDGTNIAVDICAIVATNCNATYVLNPDGSATFTDNAGNTTNIPAPPRSSFTAVFDSGVEIGTHSDGAGNDVTAYIPETGLVDNNDGTITYTGTNTSSPDNIDVCGIIDNHCPHTTLEDVALVDNGDGTSTLSVTLSDGSTDSVTIVSAGPESHCNTVAGKAPSPTGTSPTAATLALFGRAPVEGDFAEEEYDFSFVRWSFNGTSWVSKEAKKPCPASACVIVDANIPNPSPGDPTTIIGSDGIAITIPTLPPECCFKVQWKNGFQEWMLNTDCSTYSLKCQYVDVDPVASLTDICPTAADPSVVEINHGFKLNGDPAIHFESVTCSDGVTTDYSVETPQNAVPPYDSARTLTTVNLTDLVTSDGKIFTHSIWVYTGPAPVPTTLDFSAGIPANVSLLSDAQKRLEVIQILCDENCDGNTVPVTCTGGVIDEDIFPKQIWDDAGENVLALIRTDAELQAYIASTKGPVKKIDGTPCLLTIAQDPGLNPCDPEIVLIGVPKPSVCFSRRIDSDGNDIDPNACDQQAGCALLSGNAQTPKVGKYESHLQYSNDGVLWVNADSFSGGEAWAEVAPNAGEYETKFRGVAFPNVDITNGTMIREQVRCIGDPASVIEDVKVMPDPQVVLGPGSASFSNATMETNECYQADQDDYQIRISYMDGSTFEVWESALWKPGQGESVDLSTLSGSLGSFGFSGSGFNLSWVDDDPANPGNPLPGTVQVDLCITQNYIEV